MGLGKKMKLAIEGGKPVRENKLPLNLPYLGEEELNAIKQAIDSTWISGDGPFTRKFEEDLAKYLKVKHAFFVNSCTSAMHLALMTNNINSGNIAVPDFTFTSTALVGILEGVRPKLIEVDYKNGNMNPESLKKLIDKDTKAIFPVHYAGHPCDMDEINEIAKDNNSIVIEDAAHAIGSEYKGKKAGNLGDIGCFSFHSIKNITCGEGGALVTNDDKIAEHALVMREKGTNKRKFIKEGFKLKTGYYDYISKGHSFVQSDILAAVIYEQLKKLDQINDLREKHAKYLLSKLKHLNKISLPIVKDYVKTNWFIFGIKFPEEKCNWVVEALDKEGIHANIHYTPLNMTTLYKKYGYKEGDFPMAEKFYRTFIRVPMYPQLNKEDLDDIIEAIKKISEYL